MTASETEPPSGAPTFVFTDIQGSSALWEAVPESMGRALRAHDALMHAAYAATGGYPVKAEGDAFMIAFAESRDAVHFAQSVQQTLAQMSWPTDLKDFHRRQGIKGLLGLRVRIGIHRGKAEVRPNVLSGRADYFGAAVNVAARLSDMAHGAQTLVSEATLKHAGSPQGCVVSSLGPIAVRGMKKRVVVHQMVAAAWWPIEFPPPRLGKIAVEDAEGRPVDRPSLGRELEGAAYQLLARAQIERLAGHIDAARFELRALTAIAEWLGEPELVAEGLFEEASLESNQGEYLVALNLVDRVLAGIDEAEDSPFRCRTLLEQSTFLRLLSRYDEARRSAVAALVLSWRVDDLQFTAQARGTLAELDRMEGAIDKAEAGMRAALSVLRTCGDGDAVRALTQQLGMLLVERGDAEAVTVLGQLVEEFEGLRMTTHAAATRANLSLHFLDIGAEDAFFGLNGRAAAVFDAAEQADNRAACVLNSAFFHLSAGDLESAWDDLWRAAERFPVAFEPGLDLEGALLHAWLLYLRGEAAQVEKALSPLAEAAGEDRSLLGPMVLQLVDLLTQLQRRDRAAAEAVIAAHSAPATVTFRVAWRSMVAAVAGLAPSSQTRR
jgi:class 3 adenylate cyclase/tetratricopeptide (TPR) repeat protein